MTNEFKLAQGPKKDGPLLTFGPLDPETGLTCHIPMELSRRVLYPALNLEVQIDCIFSGERLEIERLTIESKSSYVASRDLTQLALPQVMNKVVSTVVLEARDIEKQLKSTLLDKPDGPAFLAQLYWFEFVRWGSPRALIMSYMGWSRANANFHMKKINKLFPLPGTRSIAGVDSQRGNDQG